MMNLIAYRVRHITPTQHDWLDALSDVVDKYFVYVVNFRFPFLALSLTLSAVLLSALVQVGSAVVSVSFGRNSELFRY